MTTKNFTELLDEYLELTENGPQEKQGYTDKKYYARLRILSDAMNKLAPGRVEVPDDNN